MSKKSIFKKIFISVCYQENNNLFTYKISDTFVGDITGTMPDRRSTGKNGDRMILLAEYINNKMIQNILPNKNNLKKVLTIQIFNNKRNPV